jgi:hypothetical protein
MRMDVPPDRPEEWRNTSRPPETPVEHHADQPEPLTAPSWYRGHDDEQRCDLPGARDVGTTGIAFGPDVHAAGDRSEPSDERPSSEPPGRDEWDLATDQTDPVTAPAGFVDDDYDDGLPDDVVPDTTVPGFDHELHSESDPPAEEKPSPGADRPEPARPSREVPAREHDRASEKPALTERPREALEPVVDRPALTDRVGRVPEGVKGISVFVDRLQRSALEALVWKASALVAGTLYPGLDVAVKVANICLGVIRGLASFDRGDGFAFQIPAYDFGECSA